MSSVGKDDVVWAMSVAVMVVLVIGSLCCLAKCNANMLTKRRKRKLRAAERRRSRKEKKMAEVKVEAATAPAPATETRPKEDKVQGSSMLTLIPYTPPSN